MLIDLVPVGVNLKQHGPGLEFMVHNRLIMFYDINVLIWNL